MVAGIGLQGSFISDNLVLIGGIFVVGTFRSLRSDAGFVLFVVKSKVDYLPDRIYDKYGQKAIERELPVHLCKNGDKAYPDNKHNRSNHAFEYFIG